jgi:type II secretion system protein G
MSYIAKRTSGFTIVELLIVIVVIAILATISVVAYAGIQVRARDSQRQQDIKQIVAALEMYYLDNGAYPNGSGSTTINSSWSTTADASWQNFVNALTPYMGNVPRDPTSTPGGNVQAVGNYNYAYFSSGSYCRSVAVSTRQTYILLYQLEGSSETNTLIGDCPANTLGPYASASNYRVVR